MKIYLIEKDSGESYEDHRTQIVAAFTTYRKASESLLSEGYTPYPQKSFITNYCNVRFVLNAIEGQPTLDEIEEMRKEDESNGHYDEDYDNYGYEMWYDAEIIEIELQE